MPSMFDPSVMSDTSRRKNPGVKSFLAEKCEADNAREAHDGPDYPMPWCMDDYKKDECWREYRSSEGMTFDFED